jgi:F-type H+-transporting ATPase subunit gamma
MATLKQIRRRIRSVQSTQQITKAMEMVAASKLKRAQERVLASRPYAAGITRMLESLAGASESLSHPLFEQRPVSTRLIVVIASDKGLCGSYNMNVFRAAERAAQEPPAEGQPVPRVRIVPVGRRANQYFAKRPWEIPLSIPELGDQVELQKARRLAQDLVKSFREHEADRVDLLYTQYVSTMSRRIKVETILPIAARREEKGPALDYIFEPSPRQIFDTLLPRFVENRVLQALAESLASEHAARMVSMGAATKNAGDVIANLTLVRNRLRQAAITREISEIVGGADALA